MGTSNTLQLMSSITSVRACLPWTPLVSSGAVHNPYTAFLWMLGAVQVA